LETKQTTYSSFPNKWRKGGGDLVQYYNVLGIFAYILAILNTKILETKQNEGISSSNFGKIKIF